MVMVCLCGELAGATGGDRSRAMLAAAGAPLLSGAMIRTHFDLVPVVVVLVAYGVALALSPGGTRDSLSYHIERPVQVESSPAVVLRALDSLGAGQATPDDGHRSDGLDHPASGVVTAVFAALMAAAVALLTRGAAQWRSGDPPGPRALVLAGLGATVAFALFAKVLSPQFLIWVVPLFALAVAWRMGALAVASALAIVLTLVEFPAHYGAVVDREPWALALVAGRDATLVAVVALALRTLGARKCPAAPAPGSARSRWRGRPRRPRSAPR
ncbi:MAG: hypothetical protein ACR2J6_06470 [Thermoleophilaceae bacterium]